MWRAAARNRGRRIAVHRVGRMRRAIIDNDRRAVVIASEIETSAGILLDVDFVRDPPDLLSRKFAPRSNLLDFIGYGATSAKFSLGMRHRESRDLAGNRPTLRLVGVEDGRWRPAIEMRGNQPGQVHGIGNSGVHAVAGV